MSEHINPENSAGQTNEEVFSARSGQTATLHTSAHEDFARAMEGSGQETVEVAVASIAFEDGKAVNFGVRVSELLRHIRQSGNPDSAWAGRLEVAVKRMWLFTTDGTKRWQPFSRLLSSSDQPTLPDSYDAPHFND